MPRTKLLAVAALSLSFLSFGSPASAGEKTPPTRPRTAQEHRAEAKVYRDRAESYRAEARKHRSMLDSYFGPGPFGKSGVVQEDDKWLIEHCRRFAERANALAETASALAQHHEKESDKASKPDKPTKTAQ